MGENTHQNCTRQNKNKEDPGRQQPCWGFLFCTNLTQPTGNLDEDTAKDIVEIFKSLAHDQDKCVIVVTHSKELAEEADVILTLKQGTVIATEDTVQEERIRG